jgi:AraC family transcriptional regulator of adaptative response / DNA-3-methyladenine glycosylase II
MIHGNVRKPRAVFILLWQGRFMDTFDAETCYRILKARDAWFDGRLFVGVTSTGIYCRPICPARTPKQENCTFHASAAAAQEAGFRPCLRCRPETAPHLGSWRGTSNTVSRGLALIADGALDGEADVDALAERLGIGERQLRRLFKQHLGASPIAVAQTRRVLFAKQLIHETRLPMSEVALAAGFGSVRRFNETFQMLYARPPSALRRKGSPVQPEGSAAESGVTVRLAYAPPYDWETILEYLRARAIPGVETVRSDVYSRVILLEGKTGTVSVAHDPARNALAASIRFPELRALPGIVARLRRVFDLDTDIGAISAQLQDDPLVGPMIAQRPGLRIPGGWDGFELGVRAILGQQVSVEAGRRLAGGLVALCGPVAGELGRDLNRAFPSAGEVASADLSGMRMPNARKVALKSLAEAVLADPLLFQPLSTIDETVSRLCRIKGIGEWTAHYIALRAMREPDAFPSSDIGLLRAAADAAGVRPGPGALQRRAEAWRPWRAYAAQHLWAADAAAAKGGTGHV